MKERWVLKKKIVLEKKIKYLHFFLILKTLSMMEIELNEIYLFFICKIILVSQTMRYNVKSLKDP